MMVSPPPRDDTSQEPSHYTPGFGPEVPIDGQTCEGQKKYGSARSGPLPLDHVLSRTVGAGAPARSTLQSTGGVCVV